MKINKEWPFLEWYERGEYIMNANLQCTEALEINLDYPLVIKGDVEVSQGITSKHGLKVEGNIKAGTTIEVGLYIKASGNIEAGGGIYARTSIEAGGDIIAGGDIYVTGYIIARAKVTAGKDIVTDSHGNIEAGDDISAGGVIEAASSIIGNWNIFAGGHIFATRGINAGAAIVAKSFIYSGGKIFAGINPAFTSDDFRDEIECTELRGGKVCHGDLIIKHSEVVMTIAEIEAKLGIKNLKIKE